MQKLMKFNFGIAILAIVLISGCNTIYPDNGVSDPNKMKETENNFETKADEAQQIIEAEKYFEKSLSKDNTTAVYPNRVTIKIGENKAFWPAFFNSTKETLEVKTVTKCENVEKIVDFDYYTTVEPEMDTAFVVKVFANQSTPLREQVCTVDFVSVQEKLATTHFVLAVEE